MFLAGGPFGLGPLELFIILIVLLLVFGVGKIADLGSSLGTGIREFRKNIKEDEPAEQPQPPAAVAATPAPPIEQATPQPAPPVASVNTASASAGAPSPSPSGSTSAPETVSAIKCPSCGSLNPVGARHCTQCGTALGAPVS